MMQSKKVRLEPNQEQEKLFWRFSSANRTTWNLCKAQFDAAYQEDGTYLNLQDLRHYMKNLKENDPQFAWLKEVPVAITNQAIRDLLDAYKRFYATRKKNGYDPEKVNKYKPKFKSKVKASPSFYQRTDGIHKTDETHLKITGIKTPVKCKALKNIDLPDRIQNPRITFDGKYWYLSYSFEILDQAETFYEREILGIDLGIKDFVVLSNGKHYPNINKDPKMKKLIKRLNHLQRQVAKKYERNVTYDSKGEKIYHKTKNIQKLENKIKLLKRKIKNIQRNYMYEVIQDILALHPKTIVIEELNVKGMLQNPNLARSVQEQNFFEFKRILTYKCAIAHIELRSADPWYPSSKKCSRCGQIKKDLKLSDRIYHCDSCGLIIDRDENAAFNLENCDKYKILN